MTFNRFPRRLRAGTMLLCGAALLATPIFAQDDAPPPPPAGQMQGPPPPGSHGPMNPERRIERMKHELNLTADQTTQLRLIFEETRGKMEALRSNTALAEQDRHAQMMTIHQAEQDKIKAMLTPDQRTQYDAMQQRMHEHMRDRRDGAAGDEQGPPPPPPPPPTPQS